MGQGNFVRAKNVAILLAGGVGLRFASPYPKQFHKMGGKAVYLYALETLLKSQAFDQIIIPVPPAFKEAVSQEITALHPDAPVQIISGGSTRQLSSYLALQACPAGTEYVLIHDAIRPFLSSEIISRNLESVRSHLAVDTCIPSADTLVHSKHGDRIDEIPPRQMLLRGQTPQTFSFDLILKAHQKAFVEGSTNSSDDCSLVVQLGHPVHIVPGEERNIKITTEFDLFLAEQILRRPSFEIERVLPHSLEGKVFAVTGASGGIGKALCEHLTKLGAKTLEISQTGSTFQADLTNFQEVEHTFEQIAKTHGAIDGLINGIGSLQVKEFDQLSQEEIQKTINANLTSIIYCCRCVKIKKGGHIINISSSSYSKGRKEYPVYSASKAAVVNFTQGLADARPDLCVNVIVPQRTDTPLRRSQFPLEDASALLRPEEIADKISEVLKNPACTGSILEVRKKYDQNDLATFD